MLTSGCRGGPPAPPPPVGPPAIVLVRAALDGPTDGPLLVPPALEGVVDELLASPVLRDPGFRGEVEAWVDYWRETAAPWVPDYLARMGAFGQTVDSALAARGMPASLRYLPFIESGYNPSARSRAAAVGMWQLMAGTARDHGMEVTTLVDERRNPFKATETALDYLDALHDGFGSWFLALAAYNGGPTRARRILSRRAPLARPTDSLFWALRAEFPRETREFVPKLVAAIIVGGSPGLHGYDARPAARFAFDEASVPDATTLDVVARAAGASEAEIVRLNPELVRGITPPGRRYTVRVPEGSGASFEARYALIPPRERVSFVEHTVAPGETLSHIARRYRISVSDLRAANPDVRPRYLRVGARLTVPIVTGARGAGG